MSTHVDQPCAFLNADVSNAVLRFSSLRKCPTFKSAFNSRTLCVVVVFVCVFVIRADVLTLLACLMKNVNIAVVKNSNI